MTSQSEHKTSLYVIYLLNDNVVLRTIYTYNRKRLYIKNFIKTTDALKYKAL